MIYPDAYASDDIRWMYGFFGNFINVLQKNLIEDVLATLEDDS
jgi:hypothetical protein